MGGSFAIWHITGERKKGKKLIQAPWITLSFQWKDWIKALHGNCCLLFYGMDMENIALERYAIYNTRSFISKIFIRNARLKLANNQANAKQHPETEHLLFENYSHSSSRLSSKNNRTYSKLKQKNKCFCIHGIMWLFIMKMKMKNKSHIYYTNRPRSRHWKI